MPQIWMIAKPPEGCERSSQPVQIENTPTKALTQELGKMFRKMNCQTKPRMTPPIRRGKVKGPPINCRNGTFFTRPYVPEAYQVTEHHNHQSVLKGEQHGVPIACIGGKQLDVVLKPHEVSALCDTDSSP